MLNSPWKHLGHGQAIQPRPRIKQILQNRPFHSDDGIGSEETGVLTPKWLAAPNNDLDLLGRIRTYGLPKRVTTSSSPAATESSNRDSLRNLRNVTVFMSDNMSYKRSIGNFHS
jgi:hypothetical protein